MLIKRFEATTLFYVIGVATFLRGLLIDSQGSFSGLTPNEATTLFFVIGVATFLRGFLIDSQGSFSGLTPNILKRYKNQS